MIEPNPSEGESLPPFEPCVRCQRGDVATGFALEGERDWIVRVLGELGVPRDRAGELLEPQADRRGFKMNHLVSIDPESGDTALVIPVRLCQDCAEEYDIQIGDVPKLPLTRQSEVEAKGDAGG